MVRLSLARALVPVLLDGIRDGAAAGALALLRGLLGADPSCSLRPAVRLGTYFLIPFALGVARSLVLVTLVLLLVLRLSWSFFG